MTFIAFAPVCSATSIPGLKPTALQSGLTDQLDWDMWLGPAPARPFDPFRCIYNFRWFWDYSGGQMTNWGAHHLDIARWIVGAKAPISVSGAGGRYALKDGGETPDVQEVTYQFPGVVVTWTSSEISQGAPFTLDIFGTKGMLSLTRGGFEVKPEMAAKKPLMEPLRADGTDLNGAHARNFLDCIKTRRKPNADVEEGHLSAVMCHLGNISTRLGRTLHWDAEKEQIIRRYRSQRLAGPAAPRELDVMKTFTKILSYLLVSGHRGRPDFECYARWHRHGLFRRRRGRRQSRSSEHRHARSPLCCH